MRIFAFLALLLFSFPVIAATNDDMFPECVGLVRAAEGSKEITGIRCLGYIEALVPGLRAIHQHYEIAFPKLKYPIEDQATANRYLSTIVLMGYDACIPETISPYVVGKIIVKYGNAHPEKLTKSFFGLSNEAMADAYPCGAH